MATISFNSAVIGVNTGSTWGTAISVATGFSLRGTVGLSGGFETILSADIGQAGVLSDIDQGNLNANLTVTCDSTYNQAWQTLWALYMGRELAQVEQTGGQGDYLHNAQLASSNKGKFATIAWLVEDDRAFEAPSVKVIGVTYTTQNNNKGQWVFSCLADSIRIATTNSVAILNALTSRDYYLSIAGGANCYLRFAPYSSSTALTSGNNLQFGSWGFSSQRPHETRFANRGANSGYTLEPHQSGPIRNTVNLEITEPDDSISDFWNFWGQNSVMMAEFQAQGQTIAAGGKFTHRFRFPKMKALGDMPGGFDLPNNTGISRPTIAFEALSATTAPAGFNGLGEAIISSCIDTLNDTWS